MQLFLLIVPAGFGMQGILSIINSQLNTMSKPLQASLILVVQMLVIGLPCMLFGKYLAGIAGIFAGLAITYLLGGLISLLVNRSLLRQIGNG